MKDFVDEMFETQTLSPSQGECSHEEESHSSCQCKSCREKRRFGIGSLRSKQFGGQSVHESGCKCRFCQRKRDAAFQEDQEDWLDSLMNWGGSFFSDSSATISYSGTQGEDYGSKWKNNQVPGLPTWARKTSAQGAAIPHVEAKARQMGLGKIFVKAVVQMAKTESGGRFALPAINFNNDPPSLRPSGKSLITAWGVFQFNRDAWTCLVPASERNAMQSFKPNGVVGCGGCRDKAGCAYPWDSTAREEISRPIQRYAELFREVRLAGGSEVDAAAGLRLWHVSPGGWHSPWLRKARVEGFGNAWASLPSEARSRVGTFLNNAGITLSISAEFNFEEEEEWGGSAEIEDRTAFSPRSKRKRERNLQTVYALVLHQMGFTRGNDSRRYDTVTAHFAILPDGKITQLHPLTSLLYASHGFNTGSVAVEFAGNFPSTRRKCWSPQTHGCHILTSAQVESGRQLIKHLIDTIGLTHVLAHRQSYSQRQNDPGPDIWKQVGQWAVENHGLSDGGPDFKVGSGQAIPDEWRNWGG